MCNSIPLSKPPHREPHSRATRSPAPPTLKSVAAPLLEPPPAIPSGTLSNSSPTKRMADPLIPINPTEEQLQNRTIAAAGGTPSPYVPTSTPTNRSIDTNATAAEDYLGKFTAPETADQIAERKRKESQGLIDSINHTFNDQVGAAQKTGQERVAMDNAVSVLSGLT